MNVILKIDNYNVGADGINIYRSETPILDNALPAPLATIPASALSYTDTTAEARKLYYYRIGVFVGSDIQVGRNIAIRAVLPADTGPGPQSLTGGDWDLGIFGYVKSADFITYANYVAAFGITTGTAASDQDWLKVAYKGKVLYVPINFMRLNVTYNAIYSAGAVYGTNDNGLATPTGAVASNQYKPMLFGQYTLIPRLLKGCGMGAPTPANRDGRTPPADRLAENEYDAIIGAMSIVPIVSGDDRNGRFGSYDVALWPVTTSSTLAYMDMTPQPDSSTPGFYPGRGGKFSSTAFVPATQTTWPMPGSLLALTVATATMSSTFFVNGGSVVGAWRGILELAL